MKKGIILAIGVLALLAGCQGTGDKKAGIPIEPKWKGAPYHLAFDTTAKKPTGTGITIPAVKYTANPETLESRVVLVLRFNVPGKKNADRPIQRMIGFPVDIKGEEGTLPADYMDRMSKGLTDYLAAYCAEGTANVQVAFARSSINSMGDDNEVEAKRLSEWLPIDLPVKKAKGKC